MKYTEEQKQKILKYIKTKAEEGSISESVSRASTNGNIKVVYTLVYGKARSDTAIIKFVGGDELRDIEMSSLAKNYKNYKIYITFPKWELYWETETDDDNLEVLNTLCEIENDVSLADYLKISKPEPEKTLRERFFEEN